MPSSPSKKKTVLLAVSGMSPAILTETVWALSQEKIPTIPDEVVVITTTKGVDDINNQLLSSKPDWKNISVWQSLRRSVLGKETSTSSALLLATPRIIELPDPQSGKMKPADDLRTPQDNAAAADFILEEVRRLTENPDVRVIASIAGGRKTMGALLYASMSLLGRETDRLTHVLVNEPYDRCPDFYFPNQPKISVSSSSHKSLSAKKAVIDLADIPFVTLRNLFQRDLSRRPGSFAGLVIEASNRLPDDNYSTIHIRTDERIMEVDHAEIHFSTRQFILVLLLAQRCKNKEPSFTNHTHVHEAYQKLCEKLRSDTDIKDFSDWRNEIPKQIESDDIRKIFHSIRTRIKKTNPSLSSTFQSRQGVFLKVNPAILHIK